MDELRAGSGEQQRARSGMLDCAAAQGENEGVLRGQAGDGRMFAVAERSFAVASEEFSNGCGSFCLDQVIHIEKVPAQTAGKQRTDSAFARSHKASEDDAPGRSGLSFGLEFSGHSCPDR